MKNIEYRHLSKTLTLMFVWVIFLTLNNNLYGQTLYSKSIETIDGKVFQLQNFAGKKIWVVILPVSKSSKDSILMYKIDSIAQSNSKYLQTIVVPSYELGYKKEKNLDDWYRYYLNMNTLISKPVFTHSVSGKAKQDPFFYWLTHSASNAHFDKEIDGPGAMFLIDEQGLLKGTFDSKSIQNNSYLSLIFK
jgi:glutathione peroxidase-family protein